MALKGFFATFLPFFVTFLSFRSFRFVLSIFPLFRSTEFESAGASFRVLEFFDFTVPAANPNNQVLVLMWRWIDTQIEARDFHLQDAIVNKRANACGNVHSVSGHAPFGADQFAPLRHR